MDENTTQVEPMGEDAILPEGWAENDDIFGDDWTGDAQDSVEEPAAEPAQETAETPVEDQSESATSNSEPSATTQGAAVEDNPTLANEQDPATAAPEKFKFQADLDHQQVDVEVGKDEIKEIYEKAYATDRLRKKLDSLQPTMSRVEQIAKQFGYDTADEWVTAAMQSRKEQEIEKLVSQGVHPEVAAYMADQRIGAIPEAPERPVEPEKPVIPRRDFQAEVEELYRLRPETKDMELPPDVIRDCVSGGKPLVYAYMEHEKNKTAETAASEHEELERLRKELAISRQNEAAAARAPVGGVTGGGATNTEPEDLGLKAFDDDSYF